MFGNEKKSKCLQDILFFLGETVMYTHTHTQVWKKEGNITFSHTHVCVCVDSKTFASHQKKKKKQHDEIVSKTTKKVGCAA
mmetsp:Transcript_35578/g.52156  ORF Transcript_35578/g.52156 Transcript_35578/m.52156 type:complete len:81 (-) Transcript_35578:41-283(-)